MLRTTDRSTAAASAPSDDREAWLPRLQLQAQLEEIDRRLAADTTNAELRFDRAATLARLGRTAEAQSLYLELLTVLPGHFGTLNNLGALLMGTGHRTAARTVYAEAVKHHPDNPVGHVNLANSLMRILDIEGARRHFEAALRLSPDHPEAHQGLSYLLTDLGEEEAARFHREKGFRNRSVMPIPYCGEGIPIHLLVLGSAAGGAVPIRHHIDERVFSASVVFVEFHDPAAPLPPHQLIFNAVGEADLCGPGLEAAIAMLARTSAPVINHPAAVLATGRAANSGRFSGVEGVITPKMVMLPRAVLAGDDAETALAEAGITFPCLLRSPGYHTGQHFVRLENRAALAAALPELPGTDLVAMEYLDARSADGKIRKYRVMMIDGQLYPVHAAVSHDWKVHYFSADMVESAEHRAEDQRFLAAMPEVLGPRLVRALEGIRDILGLDYGGMDFSIDQAGDLLLFEANATMVIFPPDSDERWAYRREPVQRILDAIRAMLINRVPSEQAGRGGKALPADNLDLRLERAQAAAGAGQLGQAIQILAEGAQYHQGNARLAARMAQLLSIGGLHDEARSVLAAGIRTAPGDVDLRLLMGGECLADLHFDEALAQLTVADHLAPGRSAIQADMGLIHQARGDLDAAVGCYRRALSLDPKDAHAHVKLATALLAQGDDQEGFKEYEWRLGLPGHEAPNPGLPRWRGELLHRQRLLVTLEQGYGDMIQFARFLPQLKGFGGEVVLECLPALARLFTGIDGVSRIVPPGEAAADLWVPLVSLPFILGEAGIRPSATPPYLSVPPNAGFDLPPGDGLKVGLVWSGRLAQGDAYTRKTLNRRSCPVEQLAPLLAVEGVTFYSLQVDEPQQRIAVPPKVHNLAPQLGDFADTAAAIAQLDLVIAIDTAAAHLAGALGGPLWIMLSAGQCDYRWGRSGGHSPWYPQARLFRDDGMGWPGLCLRIAEALGQWVQGETAPSRQ